MNDVPGSAAGAGTWQLAIPAMAVDPVTWTIYIAWPDSRNGNLDIYAAASTDGGLTWSQNRRVNDDTGGSIQYMVDLAVDSRGTVHAAWEDKRNGSWNIYYSNSTDGGQTWAANLPISSDNTSGSYARPGDYFAVEAGPDDSIAIVWTDGRGSDFDIYYARSPSFVNVRITDGSSPYSWQVEPTMVINRTGGVFVGWKETDGSEAAGRRVGFSYSTNRGATWAANILMNQSHPTGGCSNSDPWMALGPDDRVHYAYLEYDCANGQNGLDVANTSDGQTWSAVHYAQGAGGLTDKDSIAISPPGRIYAAWDEGNAMDVTWSDDGGTSWAPFRDPDDHPGGVLGAVIQIGVPVASITVTTSPSGLPMAVDGVVVQSPAAYGWLNGSSHTIGVSSPISGATGTRFVWMSWSDGGAMSHSIVADSDRTITASLQKQYQAKIGPDRPGLAVLVDNLTYNTTVLFWWDDGSSHYVEAPTPQSLSDDVRYIWTSWSDGGRAAHSVTANTALVLTANFVEQHAMRVSTSPAGVPFSVDGTTYSTATTFWFAQSSYHAISVAAIQYNGTETRYRFESWNDGNLSSNRIVLFTDTVFLQAAFATEYHLTVTSPVPGTSGTGWYSAGATALATVSNSYYSQASGERLAFAGWSGDATGLGLQSDAILMDGPKTAIALFGTQFYLDVASDYGLVSGAGWYDRGTIAFATIPSLQVDVSPGTRELFVGWSSDADGTGLTSTGILMDRSKVATAMWQTQYSLTVQAAPGEATNQPWYNAGTTVVASLASGIVPGAAGTRAVFISWIGDSGGTNPAGSEPFIMNGPRTVGTTWRTEYELRIDSAYGGVVGAGWYQAGSVATASVNSSVIGTASGERVAFQGWGGDATGDAAYRSNPILMSGPRTAHAQWSKEYFLQVVSDVGSLGGSGWYMEGASVELRAPTQVASSGQTYRFAGWSGGVTSAETTVTVTVTGPMTVRASWQTAEILGGWSDGQLGLIVLVIGIALVVGLLVARSVRRRK